MPATCMLLLWAPSCIRTRPQHLHLFPVPVQPRLQRRQDENTVQIIWADGEIKITRQPHDNINYPDLYCLWKKVNTKMNRLDDSLKFY